MLISSIATLEQIVQHSETAMANEFYYCVSLDIVHPTIDPQILTSQITELSPRREVKAGQYRRNTRGELVFPKRRVPLSHWSAQLHPGTRLYSGTTPLSACVLNSLSNLERHKDLFHELIQDGRVVLDMAWFSNSNYLAETISADVLKACANLHLSLELNVFVEHQSIFPDVDG